MKNLKLTFLIVFISTFTCLSQSNSNIGNTYKFTEDITLYGMKKIEIPQGVAVDNTKLEKIEYEHNSEIANINKNTLFKITDVYDNIYIIKVYSVDDNLNSKLFALNNSQLSSKTDLIIGEHPKYGFVTSAIMLPVKIRFGDGEDEDNSRRFNFEGNVNVGLAAGFRLRINKNGLYYLNFMGGLNIGSTKLTEENTNGGVTNDTNTSILTPFAGILFEYNDFEIGAFLGWDHISGKLGKKWHYQGNTWLGIGMGYNIFTSKEKVAPEETVAKKKKKLERKAYKN